MNPPTISPRRQPSLVRILADGLVFSWHPTIAYATPRRVCEKMFRSQQFAFGVGRWLLNNRLKVQLIFLCKYLQPAHELLCIRCRVCAEITPNLGTRLFLCQWWQRRDIFAISFEILGAESSGNTAASIRAWIQDKCSVPLFRNALEVDDDGTAAWSYHRRR